LGDPRVAGLALRLPLELLMESERLKEMKTFAAAFCDG
jgi:hypothetical protein